MTDRPNEQKPTEPGVYRELATGRQIVIYREHQFRGERMCHVELLADGFARWGSLESIPAGNWQKLGVPDDNNLKGVVESYERQGERLVEICAKHGWQGLFGESILKWIDAKLGAPVTAGEARERLAEKEAVTIEQLRTEWQKIPCFATCDSGPEGFKVTLKYQTLKQAQDAYSAIGAIDKLLAPKPAFVAPEKPEHLVRFRQSPTGKCEWMTRQQFESYAVYFVERIDPTTGEPIAEEEA